MALRHPAMDLEGWNRGNPIKVRHVALVLTNPSFKITPFVYYLALVFVLVFGYRRNHGGQS